MSEDRELLELAAKAAGAEINGYRGSEPVYATESEVAPGEFEYTPWSPLTDDGDALRLAVKLGIEYGYGFNKDGSIQRIIVDDSLHVMVEGDPYAATRRAIVRAAADIGKQ